MLYPAYGSGIGVLEAGGGGAPYDVGGVGDDGYGVATRVGSMGAE